MILLIGGTANANEIAQRLARQCAQQLLVSVTTDFGLELAELTGCTVIKDVLTKEKMLQLVHQRAISAIVDASHPFAIVVSKTAMEVAALCGIRYYRFERKIQKIDHARYFESYENVVDYSKLTEGNILITTGSKYCAKYASLERSRLFIRVLATADSIALCEAAGFIPQQISTISGVQSLQMNINFMHRHNIRYLVTKDSGADGGLLEKAAAAQSVDAELLIISRPSVQYQAVFSEYEALITAVVGC